MMLIRCLLTGAALLCSIVSHAQASFNQLPTPTGLSFTNPFGISADGQTIVGSHTAPGVARAFIWTASGGMQDLHSQLSTPNSEAYGISGNGSTVVGALNALGARTAFRWTSGGGVQSLGLLPGTGASYAVGASGDGATIIGNSGNRGFRWTAGGGMVSLGALDPGGETSANAISGDGSAIVGQSGAPSNRRAFRWTASGGLQDLGTLSGGGGESEAKAVSADGTVIVGTSVLGSPEAFRWTPSTGMVGLGFLPGATSSIGEAVSPNGSLVAGTSDGTAFLWRADVGMLSLRDVLVDAGLGGQLAGWELRTVTALTVVGSNVHLTGQGTFAGDDRAFVAVLPTAAVPEPASVSILGALIGGGLLRRRLKR